MAPPDPHPSAQSDSWPAPRNEAEEGADAGADREADAAITARKAWMSTLAVAPAARLAALWHAAGPQTAFTWLRPPEIGTTMVRGRAGALGAAFNLGEITVTRCALRISSGEEGHAYVQGRDRDKARIAALVDALMQTPAAATLEPAILRPLARERAAARADRATRAEATRVSFFTMARGEG